MIKAGKQVFVCFSEKDITITASDSEEKLRDILKVREFQKNYKGLTSLIEPMRNLKKR